MEDKIKVMVNGLGAEHEGKMARIIAGGIIDSEDYELLLNSLTGPDRPRRAFVNPLFSKNVQKIADIELVRPGYHDDVLERVREKYDKVVAIDFCKGEGVADRNAELYHKFDIPFVMGSTGADYSLIERLAVENENPCVAAPNMDPQIVSFMDGIRYMADSYPGSWEGYLLMLSETHQADKINKETGLPETSGTMKAMLKNLGALTSREVSIGEILSERSPKTQQSLWQVPEQWLGWHAYHIFKVFKPVEGAEDSLVITIKRHGGECYRQGTMKALDWLVDGIQRDLFNNYDGSKTESQENRRYFNTMFNVLKKA
jgi:dihydrodipicolinate reductase